MELDFGCFMIDLVGVPDDSKLWESPDEADIV